MGNLYSSAEFISKAQISQGASISLKWEAQYNGVILNSTIYISNS